MSDSKYKMALHEFAMNATDEEFDKVIGRFEKLHRGIGDIIETANPLLSLFGLRTEEPAAKVTSICLTCASPCPQQTDDKVFCETFKEKLPDCLTCFNWDLDTCMLQGTCEGAKHYEPREDGPIDV